MYLDYLTDRSFQGVNRIFVLFSKMLQIEQVKRICFLLTVNITYNNIIIDDRNVFGQPVKNDIRTYRNITKNAISQRDDCTAGCLLDYPYFKENYKLNAIDLSKQQTLDTDT